MRCQASSDTWCAQLGAYCSKRCRLGSRCVFRFIRPPGPELPCMLWGVEELVDDSAWRGIDWPKNACGASNSDALLLPE